MGHVPPTRGRVEGKDRTGRDVGWQAGRKVYACWIYSTLGVDVAAGGNASRDLVMRWFTLSRKGGTGKCVTYALSWWRTLKDMRCSGRDVRGDYCI